MRRRRADRCLVRAAAALDAEVPEIAQGLLAEARALDPRHPELQEIEERLLAAPTLVAAPMPDRRLPVGLTFRELLLLLGVALLLIGAAASIDPADVEMLLKHLLTTAASPSLYVTPSA